jgi:hypothetical protein
MQWKQYRITSTRVATGDSGGPRRVLELLDGRVVIEYEGAPSKIVDVPFEDAQGLAVQLVRVAERTGLLSRFGRWLRRLFGGAQ